ncbi:MAG: bifunctional 4-hydroxy-2-oxoglutarate aldolase/2-dehydro-3-deoxy-phosphogluconate aldolase [Oscillospiraceae bacterium]
MQQRLRGCISIPGAFTPSEIVTAYEAGADFVKLFPADCVDLHYIKAIRAPINHIPLLAVSGVTPENLGDYLKAGMAGAGIGSASSSKSETLPPIISMLSPLAPRAMSLWSKASDPIAGSQKPGWRLQHQPGDIMPAHPREGRAGIFVGSYAFLASMLRSTKSVPSVRTMLTTSVR